MTLDRGEPRQNQESKCHAVRHKALTSGQGWDTLTAVPSSAQTQLPLNAQERMVSLLEALPT